MLCAMRTLLRVLLCIMLSFALMVLGGGLIGPVEILLLAVLSAAVVFGGPLMLGRLKRARS